MKCAVVIPIAPDQQADFEVCCQSVEKAWAHGQGAFQELEIVPIWDTTGAMTPAERRNTGIDIARARDCEWIFFLNATDLLNASAFADFAHYHAELDAVWGNICENILGTNDVTLRTGQLVTTSRIEDILRCSPEMTLRMGHFVRTECASAVRFDANMALGEDYKYFLDLWARYRCAKVAHVFSIERCPPVVDEAAVGGAAWEKAVEQVVLDHCRDRALLCDVTFAEKTAHFVIDNPFDIIQRHHGHGHFFEIAELKALRTIVGSGKTIVEVGANVGNHLVFYAQHMKPKKIFPFEPNPDAVRLLTKNIRANKLESVVDERGIGIGAGAEYGKFAVMLPGENNLGAARLTGGSGELEVFPLDETLEGETVDFMKIDVEGMEFDVLKGAEKLIQRDKPVLMIEVFRPKIPDFESWCDSHGYKVATTFQCVHAVNFVAVAA